MQELVAIGRIVRPVGVRGEVKIVPLTDDPGRFDALARVFVGSVPEQSEERLVTEIRVQRDSVVVRLAGLETRETAEQYRDAFLFVEQTKSVRPRRGSFFVDDVIGCTVVLPSGQKVGTVQDIMTLPANDVWVVRDGEREHLIPAVKALILSVDVKARRIEVADLDGLFT